MDCSIIIVNYKTFDLTCQAVDSALESARPIEAEVIVVDNASPDESGHRLARKYAGHDRVRIALNETNAGFAAANNVGADIARGSILFFLNSDTIVHDDAIPKLCQFLDETTGVGAAGPRVLNPDGSDQVSTGRFQTLWGLIRFHLPVLDLLRGKGRRSDTIPTKTSPVDVVKGCALAVTREVYDAVGGWDDSYFMYSEETELCYSLAKSGLTNMYLREATITHLGGGSTPDNYAEQQVVQQRSALQFLKRHKGLLYVGLNRILGVMGYGGRTLVFGALALLKGASGKDELNLRRQAASRLWRWYLVEYK